MFGGGKRYLTNYEGGIVGKQPETITPTKESMALARRIVQDIYFTGGYILVKSDMEWLDSHELPGQKIWRYARLIDLRCGDARQKEPAEVEA